MHRRRTGWPVWSGLEGVGAGELDPHPSRWAGQPTHGSVQLGQEGADAKRNLNCPGSEAQDRSFEVPSLGSHMRPVRAHARDGRLQAQASVEGVRPIVWPQRLEVQLKWCAIGRTTRPLQPADDQQMRLRFRVDQPEVDEAVVPFHNNPKRCQSLGHHSRSSCMTDQQIKRSVQLQPGTDSTC